MGSPKKQTIGYWYRLLLFYGLGRGDVDAFLEWRAGDRTVWSGEMTESGEIQVNKPDLWGGEKSEGGVVGAADVMFGTQVQTPNPYLLANLSDRISALRGKLTFAFKGGRFGTNPYPKGVSFKFRRILAGWEDGCWYPEKAAIEVPSEGPPPADWLEAADPRNPLNQHQYRAGPGGWPWRDDLDTAIGEATTVPRSAENFVGWSLDAKRLFQAYGDAPGAGEVLYLHFSRKLVTHATYGYEQTMAVFTSGGVLCGNFFDSVPRVEPGSGTFWWSGFDADLHDAYPPGIFAVVRFGEDSEGATYGNNCVEYGVGPDGYFPQALGWPDITIQVRRKPSSDLLAMNPAHMLYYSLISKTMQGEPADNIDEDSFIAAADRLFDEGFGLCTERDHASESVEQFQQRLLSLINATLTQSRTDGKYRLDLIRSDYDLESLPILTDADILEWAREPSTPADSVNEVLVEWFDPQKKEKRITTPAQNLGSIMAAGGVISETERCPEIPYERLAQRVADMRLQNKASLNNRFTVSTTRKTYNWRSGMAFRLQAPRRGIADMACLVGEISAGTLRSGAMRMVFVQDVSRLRDTTYVGIEPGVDTNPIQIPAAAPAQALIESPYVELAGALPGPELAALAEGAGYVLSLAARAGEAVNYNLATQAAGESFVDAGPADWTPTAVVVESSDEQETTFTLSSPSDLARVVIGTAAAWGSELVRVDALDPTALTITLGRGVGDTVGAEHAAGGRIWFYDQWAGTDERQYADGEAVAAKVLANIAGDQFPISMAIPATAVMNDRASRPYPPAALGFTDAVVTNAGYPTALEGAFDITWAHRDRVMQADQLIDQSAASIGPEKGTYYHLAFYEAVAGTLLVEKTDVDGQSATIVLDFTGDVRMTLSAVRAGLPSWQAQERLFAYTPPIGVLASTIVAATYTPTEIVIDGGEIV